MQHAHKSAKDSDRARPIVYARGFAWRTSPQRWPWLLYIDAHGPPLYANNAPVATPVAATMVHGPLHEVQGEVPNLPHI